jgi:hypothetical protein
VAGANALWAGKVLDGANRTDKGQKIAIMKNAMRGHGVRLNLTPTAQVVEIAFIRA